jgi:hypothetical protein
MTTAIVLGGAACVYDDVRALNAMGVQGDIVVACNDMIAHWPGKLDAVCTLHPESLAGWMLTRTKAGFPRPGRIFAFHPYTRVPVEQTEYKFYGQLEQGSSGLFALRIALINMGADKAVCCGIPMNNDAHFFDTKAWPHAHTHWKGWLQSLPEIKDRARSMSGETRKLLGAPTPEWLS